MNWELAGSYLDQVCATVDDTIDPFVIALAVALARLSDENGMYEGPRREILKASRLKVNAMFEARKSLRAKGFLHFESQKTQHTLYVLRYEGAPEVQLRLTGLPPFDGQPTGSELDAPGIESMPQASTRSPGHRADSMPQASSRSPGHRVDAPGIEPSTAQDESSLADHSGFGKVIQLHVRNVDESLPPPLMKKERRGVEDEEAERDAAFEAWLEANKDILERA